MNRIGKQPAIRKVGTPGPGVRPMARILDSCNGFGGAKTARLAINRINKINSCNERSEAKLSIYRICRILTNAVKMISGKLAIIEDEVEKIREIRRGFLDRLDYDPCKILDHFGKRSQIRACMT
jgi:hypothetical protein